MKKAEPFLQHMRAEFHKWLLESLLTVSEDGPSNADKDNALSVGIAKGITDRLQAETGVRAAAQTSGNKFEQFVTRFVQETLRELKHLHPGKLDVHQIKNRKGAVIGRYAQYAHLAHLQMLAETDRALAASLGNDYVITPDIVVTRGVEDDAAINVKKFLVDGVVGRRADLRMGEKSYPILHASISTKWTFRSDRAQNARSEALNFIRNRKGRLPHIVVVTGEPLPSRLSSLALGTGDIDCVYHFALDELSESVKASGNSKAEETLARMVEGKRLKDIADLPLDLAI